MIFRRQVGHARCTNVKEPLVLQQRLDWLLSESTTATSVVEKAGAAIKDLAVPFLRGCG